MNLYPKANLVGLFSVLLVSTASADVEYVDQAALHDIQAQVSAKRIEADINKLVSFGTRHTLSETESDIRGIGAAGAFGE